MLHCSLLKLKRAFFPLEFLSSGSVFIYFNTDPSFSPFTDLLRSNSCQITWWHATNEFYLAKKEVECGIIIPHWVSITPLLTGTVSHLIMTVCGVSGDFPLVCFSPLVFRGPSRSEKNTSFSHWSLYLQFLSGCQIRQKVDFQPNPLVFHDLSVFTISLLI